MAQPLVLDCPMGSQASRHSPSPQVPARILVAHYPPRKLLDFLKHSSNLQNKPLGSGGTACGGKGPFGNI